MEYENIIIGDFLFSLGYISCQKDIPDSQVDLYQQTPLDATVGDVLAKIGGQNFIVEFKREEKLTSKELSKKSKEFLLKSELEQSVISLSYKCHFLAFPKNMDLIFLPYISLNERYKKLGVDRFSLSNLIDALQTKTKGANALEIRQYCNLLAKKAYKSSSGIVVNVKAGRKPFVIPFTQGFSMEMKLDIELANAPSLELSRDLGRDRGPDFSF